MDDFGGAGMTYSFTGITGSGTTSGAGVGTVTETATRGTQTETIVYTAESANPALYQVTSVTHGTHTNTPTQSATSPTFAFQYNAASQATTVVETINRTAATETLTYTSGAGGSDTAFALSSDLVVITNPSTTQANGNTLSYSFGSAGSVTETVTRGTHTYSHSETANPTASFSGLNTATVSETTIAGNAVTTVTFTGSVDAGYAVQQVSTVFVPPGGNTTPLNVNPFDRAKFDFTANTVTWISPGGTAGTARAMGANSHVSFAELGAAPGLAGDFVGETVTYGSRTGYELFYSSTGTGGEYMEVAHGSGAATAVSLVGVASQLTALNQIHALVT